LGSKFGRYWRANANEKGRNLVSDDLQSFALMLLEEAEEMFVEWEANCLAFPKKNIIHNNKAANLKSGLAKHIATLK